MTTLAERIAHLSPAQRTLLLAKIRPAAHTVDLRSEAELAPSIVPAQPFSASGGAPKRVFLTGATGFLGAFLLHELLGQTWTNIHCLVRAATPVEGLEKVRQALSRYGLETPDFSVRIVPVCGDLAQPWLGMGEIRFQELSGVVDLVLHNGALVNFMYPYGRLKPANVLGTVEALRLACLGRAKPFHYVSTLSVFGNEEPYAPEGFREDDSVGPNADLDSGYSQSKWVAEQLVREASSRGLPAAIYRPATLAGDSRTGTWNTDDFFCRVLKGCVQLGSVPDEDMPFNLIPVDFAAKAVVRLATQASSLGRTFHLDGGCPVSSRYLADWLIEFGYPLERVHFEKWLERVRAAVTRSTDHPLLPLWPALEVPYVVAREGRRPPGGSRYDCRATLALLERQGMICPRVDKDLMNRYVRYFITTGFLPEPAANPHAIHS